MSVPTLVLEARARDCLSGGGQMGVLARAVDWSARPLGPVESWPASLRAAVSVVLGARVPLCIAWGPERALVYNDGFRAHLGAAALGTTGAASFEPAFLDAVMQGTSVESELFSGSPIHDDSGGVGGVLITESGGAERRLATLRQLAAATSGATSAAQVCAAVVRVLGTSAVYLVEAGGKRARLAASDGLELPEVIDVERAPGVPIPRLGDAGPAGFLVAGSREDLELVTAQIGAALAVAGGRRPIAERDRGDEALRRIGELLNAELDLDRLLQTLTDEATGLCRAQFGAYFYNVVDDGGEQYMLYTLSGRPRSAFDGFPMPRNTAIFAPTFNGERVVRSDDITRDPLYGKSEPYHGMPPGHLPVRSYLAVPVVNRDGLVLGGLFFGHEQTGIFDAHDEELLAAVASQAARAIDNARLYRDARAAEARITRLQSITAELSRAVTPAEATRALLVATMPILHAQGGVARLLCDDGQALEICASVGASPKVGRVPIHGRSPAADAVRDGKPIWLPTGEAILERYPELAAVQKETGARAAGAIPLTFEGRTIGVATFHCGSERKLSRADEDFLVAAGNQCAQAIVRARLYEEARGARADAEAASRAKDEFLAMLGHELRNPLAPIQTALQLMRLRGDESMTRERTVIERQVAHVVRLVDDLLDVSRITRGKVEIKKSVVETAEVIAKAIEMASPLVEEHHHRMVVEAPRAGLAVNADPVRLAQVFSNLLTNAAKYTARGGEITVRAAAEGGEVVVRFRDNGVGIAAEMLPRIFDMFVQARQSLDRAEGGLGLGLTIVRSLVHLHGGSVTAYSDGRGRGSEFVVRLPAVAAAGGPPRPRVAAPERAPVRHSHALRVLVVDDNTDAADLLAEGLRAAGHVADVAYDSVSALELAAGFSPEVALLDIGLPVMDGYELGQQLKTANPALRVVAITGYGQESDRRRSRDAGFDGHMVKPIQLEEIIGIVDGFARR